MSSRPIPDHDRGTPRHVRRPAARWLAAAVVPAVGLLAACGASSAEPPTTGADSPYCAALADSEDDFAVIQEGTTEEFDEAFAAFHKAAGEAPEGVADDWEVFDGAFLRLEDDLALVGLEASDLAAISAGDIPEGVDPDDLARIPDLLFELITDDVVAAANTIERHAFDECGIDLTA